MGFGSVDASIVLALRWLDIRADEEHQLKDDGTRPRGVLERCADLKMPVFHLAGNGGTPGPGSRQRCPRA
jgi:hypothetical protein